jgi:hypothetical protein
MNSLSALTRQPRPLNVAGIDEVYELHPLTIDDLGQLQGWIDSQFPDPFEVVSKAISRGNYTVPQQQYLLRVAVESASRPAHPIGTPEADQLLGSLAGLQELLKLSIRKSRPEFSDEDAKRLYMHLNLGDLEAVFAATGVGAVMADPKGPRKTNGGNGNSTSRKTRKRA